MHGIVYAIYTVPPVFNIGSRYHGSYIPCVRNVTYDAIIEDLARAGKILDPEDLAITYLNTLPDTYSSLIQSMEPVLSTLTSQSIKAKVREEEQRLKNCITL